MLAGNAGSRATDAQQVRNDLLTQGALQAVQASAGGPCSAWSLVTCSHGRPEPPAWSTTASTSTQVTDKMTK